VDERLARLSQVTVADRGAEARRFLDWLGQRAARGELADLALVDVDAYVKDRAGSLRRRTLDGLATNIRSFLRWLHMTGQTTHDLSSTVITPSFHAFESIPSALRAQEVRKVLAATRQDCPPKGMRDYAILMLLSTNGVRAGEVVALRLDDIYWREEVIRIRHSKTDSTSYLTLLPEVGGALLKYLQKSRPKTPIREMFIRCRAPYRPFKDGSSLYGLVVPARSRRGGPHRQTRSSCLSSCVRNEHAPRDGAGEGNRRCAGSPRGRFDIGLSEAGGAGPACRGLGDSDGGEAMKTAATSTGVTPQNYVRELLLRAPKAPKGYLGILQGFQRFVAEQAEDKSVSPKTVRHRLNDRIRVWPFHRLAERARVVDRILNWMVSRRALPNNPFADLRTEYGQRATAPVVRALLNPNFEAALEALRPALRFGSFLGPVMRDDVALMQAMGYRYTTQEKRFLRLDRFLQGRPDLSGRPLTVLIREWTNRSA